MCCRLLRVPERVREQVQVPERAPELPSVPELLRVPERKQ